MSSAQRLAVWNGEKKRTSGGLTKSDLTKNRHGKIVSKKKSANIRGRCCVVRLCIVSRLN